MKVKKYLSVILCIIMVAFMMISCSTQGKTEKGTDIGKIIKTAQEKLSECKSMSYDINFDIEMSTMGQSVNMKMNGNVDFINKPMAMSMDMTMDMGSMGSMPLKAYAQEKDGTYIMYTGTDMGTGSMTWSNQKMDKIDDIRQYHLRESVDMYLSCSESFIDKGTDIINGAETTRYDGTVSQNAITKVMKASGVMKQFSSLGLDESKMESMVTDLGIIPISIWVEKSSGLLVQYDMDMTNVMDNLMKNAAKELNGYPEITINKIATKVTVTDINNVDKIIIPEEALNSLQQP